MALLADTIVALALECNGLSYGDPERREAYLRHQYPSDSWANALEMGRRQSGCLLHARSLLSRQRRGDGSPELDGRILWQGAQVDLWAAPYAAKGQLGMIEGLLWELARQRGLLVANAGETEAPPELRPSDLVVIGQGGQPPLDPAERERWRRRWGGLAHGLVVTGAEGLEVESSDGGQTDPLNAGRPTAILRRLRRLVRREGGWWLEDAAGARRIGWIFRMGDLPCL